jgi:nucleoside-triphosphatase THEP1
MKGTISNCLECGTAFTKNASHQKFCRTHGDRCRKRFNRKKNGKPILPNFEAMKSKKANRINSIPQPKPLLENLDFAALKPDNIEVRPPNYEIQNLEMSKRYWQQVIEDAYKGVFPLASIGLGTLGAATAEGEGSKIFFGLLGAWIGSEIDKERAQKKQVNAPNVIANAQKQINAIENKIKELKKLNRKVNSMKREGIFESIPYSENLQFGSVITADSYRKLDIPTIKFEEPYNYLLGSPRKNFYKIVTGLPGQGKTTYCVKFATYFAARHGKVIYVQAEQPNSNADFQSVLNRTNSTGFHIERQAYNLDMDGLSKLMANYDLIILDSVNRMKLKPDELEKLKADNTSTALLAVMQSTKEGSFKGGQEYMHDCDIFVKIDKFMAHQEKSRSSLPASIEV